MACEGSYMWSLSGIVAAFVDLAIAYFLLCAATVAFLASKFLGFFGLRLPCPCDGLFGTFPNGNLCFHRLLIDFPAEKVSNVQLSIKANFPFNDNTILGKDQNCDLNWRLIGDKENSPHGYPEMGDEDGSCNSVSDARKSHNIARIELSPKGKGVMNQRQRGGIRRRRRKTAVDYGRSSSVSSYDPPYEDFPLSPPSPPSTNKEDGGNPPLVMRLDHRDSFDLNGLPDEVEHIEKNAASIEELKHNGQMVSSFNEENRTRLLERALEHEQEARDALCLELEKERNAAASAADEAMAMILRLQEEKASIEMDARQYQRLIEEKSAFEAEEMNILMEILMRTEREKHFLEKELEVYRQMTFLGNEESTVDSGNVADASSDPNEDPVLMLRQISASSDKAPIHRQKKDVSSQKQIDLAVSSYSSQEFQEKEMVFTVNSFDVPPGNRQILDTFLKSPEAGLSKQKLSDHAISLEGKVLKENSDMERHDRDLKYHETIGYQGSNCPCNLTLDKEPQFHDVHVIVDGSNFCNDVNSGESRKTSLPMEASPTQDVIRDRPSTSTSNSQVDPKSSADAASALPPVGQRGKTLLCDLRGNPMSSVDNERLKIESKLGRLRERLKIVQKGREKLDLTAEHREREKMQLKLLEDIARQLHEIRQLTEPEKAVRQASLPLPSSKHRSNGMQLCPRACQRKGVLEVFL
ncbi:myosin-binding protein 7 isoform X2 [Lycium ferocissimum]|uniref:myosin-binding protein 7 isoform X2 n=1 Tax=Lycium ferocissimum TaxID=112874 RepID=UPI0028161E26|nr:myosin-binding protein 7 isoform X2 [Lycium ferocissimum]